MIEWMLRITFLKTSHAVRCVMDFNVEYINNASHLTRPAVHRAEWYKATDENVAKYKEMVDTNIDKISLLHATLLCNDKFCEVHKTQLDEMHDNIISSLLDACNSVIPSLGPQGISQSMQTG